MGENYIRAHKRQLFCMKRNNVLLLLLTIGYVVYLLAGSAVFMKIESPVEAQLKESLLTLRNEFILKHPCVTEEALAHLITSVINARDQGIAVIHNVSDTESKWDLGESMFFATTLITTIGYGNLAPLTAFGKMFSIFYSAIGIPLTLILLSAYTNRIMMPTIFLLKIMNEYFLNVLKPLSVRMLHLFVIGMLIMVFFFIIPSIIFYYLEPTWNFLDCIYFCYISLTTIGLGDFVPGETIGYSYHFLYKIGASFYLLIGLTFIVMFLTLVSEIPELNVGLLCMNKSDEITDDLEEMKLPVHAHQNSTRYLLSDSSHSVTSTVINQYGSSLAEKQQLIAK